MKNARILVPLDFSENDRNSLRYAADLAQAKGWSLTLMHVYHPEESARKIHPSKHKDYDKGMIAYLQSFASDTLDKLPAGIRYLTRMGTPADQIIKTSQAFQLIIMSGKHYRSALDRWLSSRTSMIAAKANCPVLIVPLGTQYQPIQHIWMICRQQDADDQPQQFLNALGWNTATIDYHETPEHWIKKSLWTRIALNLFSSKPNQKLDTAIGEKLKNAAIDLIVITNHFRSNLQKLMNDESKQVVFKYQIPVLILPRDTKND